MWATNNINKAIEEFISVDHQFPINSFLILPEVIFETPACSGKFQGASSATGKEITTSFRLYGEFYRDTDINLVMADRFLKDNFGPALFTRCHTALENHLKAWPNSNDSGDLFLHSWLNVNFAMAIMGMLTSFCLTIYGNEDVSDNKAKLWCFNKAEGACRYSAEQFEKIANTLRELAADARVRTQGDVISLVIHGLLGFASEKTFKVVMDLASGKSPYQQLEDLEKTAKNLYLCRHRSLFTADIIKDEYVSQF